ncbi:hypothetical protein [Streptomyces sp. NPDC003032]
MRHLPDWLSELPSLEKLDLRWNDTHVHEDLLRTLEGKGCVVLR